MQKSHARGNAVQNPFLDWQRPDDITWVLVEERAEAAPRRKLHEQRDRLRVVDTHAVDLDDVRMLHL